MLQVSLQKDFAVSKYQTMSLSNGQMADDITNAIKESNLAIDLPSNLVTLIMEFLEIRNIFFCSNKGTELIAFSIHGDYLGTIAQAPDDTEDQWLTGFDFDSKGAVYIAMYIGFLLKFPMPSNQSIYAQSIKPREKCNEFESNIERILMKCEINENDAAPEGVVVIENDKYKSVFVTVMDPIGGVLQLSLNGELQRIITPNLLDAPWSMKYVPHWFTKGTKSSFLKNRNLLMVADKTKLAIIDIDIGKNGKVMTSLDFPQCKTGSLGDFAFINPNSNKNDKPLLIVNLQNCKLQFHQCEMFWMLKELDLKNIITPCDKQTYGTCIGPNGNDIYICDNTLNRIIKLKITDYDMILNEDKINDDIDPKYIDTKIFTEGVHLPNYSNWIDARDIALNFVNFSQDILKKVSME